MEPTVLYQDSQLLVCIKPAGVPSQSDAAGGESMVTLLSAHLRGQGQQDTVYPVHRLDQGAAGLMVYARTAKAAGALSAAIQQQRFEKEYVAAVSGCPAEPAGDYADYLLKDGRKNKVFVVDRPRKGVKQALLSYQTLETVGDDGPVTLVRVRLHTGRTHQIRVQFASRHMPLLGDGKYGSRINGGLALWSCRLAFPHPASGKTLCFEQLPDGTQPPWNRFPVLSQV